MVPLHHAAVNGDPNVIEALIKGGAKVKKIEGLCPLHAVLLVVVNSEECFCLRLF